LAQAATGLVKGVPDLKVTTEHLIAEDDLVAIRVTGEGTHTALWRGVQTYRQDVGGNLQCALSRSERKNHRILGQLGCSRTCSVPAYGCRPAVQEVSLD